jgi:hypothetical protein
MMIFCISMVFVVIYPFTFLILLIWVFLSYFSHVCHGSVTHINFIKESAFCFIDSLYFFCFYFIDFTLYFNFFFPSASFGISCSCFSMSLSYSIRSLISDLSVLLIYVVMAINIPLMTVFAVSHSSGKSCFHFH